MTNPLEDLTYAGSSGPGDGELQVQVILAFWWVGRARPRAFVSSPVGSPLLQVTVRQAMAHLGEDLVPLVELMQPFLGQAYQDGCLMVLARRVRPVCRTDDRVLVHQQRLAVLDASEVAVAASD